MGAGRTPEERLIREPRGPEEDRAAREELQHQPVSDEEVPVLQQLSGFPDQKRSPHDADGGRNEAHLIVPPRSDNPIRQGPLLEYSGPAYRALPAALPADREAGRKVGEDRLQGAAGDSDVHNQVSRLRGRGQEGEEQLPPGGQREALQARQ